VPGGGWIAPLPCVRPCYAPPASPSN
jgi:hypothetical protein